jgi:hypothetical protein
MQYIETSTNNPELRRVYFHLVDATDGITPEAGEAGGQPTISINGRTPANAVNTLQAVDASKGDYYLELSTTEIVTPRHLLLHYKSANTAHFAQQVQVMAFDPYTQFGTLGGGSGADVDYKRIKKMLDEAVGSISIPEQQQPDLIPISEGLQAVIQEIRDIKFPKQKETDLMPTLTRLLAIQNSVNAFSIPECDHKEILNRMDQQDLTMDANSEELTRHVDKTIEPIKNVLTKDNEMVKSEMKKLGEKFDDIQYVVVDKKNKQEPKSSVLEEYLKL